MGRKILVYAPINYNIVDGSSIWLQSICRVLSRLPDTQVDLLAFAAPKDLFEPLPGLNRLWMPSHAVFTNSGFPSLARGDVLQPRQACDALLILEQLEDYDYIFVRGSEAAFEIASLAERRAALIAYLTDVDDGLLWNAQKNLQQVERLNHIAETARLLFCQTRSLGALIEHLAPAASTKLSYLPPMVPDEVFQSRSRARDRSDKDRMRMLYAGKFATEWAIEEMLQVQAEMGGDDSVIDLHVYGDKFNRSADGFIDRVKPKLEAQHGFVWHGAVSRNEMLGLMPQFDLGYAYRHTSLEASPEVSTKLIEYAASGVAPVLNRTPTHEAYFGPDYPLYANSYDELRSVLTRAGKGEIDLVQALEYVQPHLAPHKMSNATTRIEQALQRVEPLPVPGRTAPTGRRNLLIVGHDQKFMGDLMANVLTRRDYRINTAKWPRFQAGGEAVTDEGLKWADTIFCEWALANAVHCSRNKQPGQKLIVRFHRFELTTGLPQQIQIGNVDAMVTVSDHMADHLVSAYDWPRDKIFVIPNSIDTQVLDRPKTAHARFNLGVLGALPKLKRLDLAAELLIRLRQRDRRFMLHVKSKLPWDLPWTWNSPEQFRHYAKVFDMVRRNHHLRGAVHFDPHGPDVPQWFQKIGWILSLSDVESFHLAGIEGMASGAVPVVAERPGADQIFPSDQVFADLDKAADHIIEKVSEPDTLQDMSVSMKNEVQMYDKERVMGMWMQLLRDLDAI